MTVTIQEYAVERGIKCLMHFTRSTNLDSILERGLIPRDTLLNEGFIDFNDQYRFDGTHAICLSIGFPNYKMFWRLRQENQDVDWVILGIHPAALWALTCAFCVTNAASSSVTSVPFGQRIGLEAFQAMYADYPPKYREILGISDDFPTNPQAEVLMIEGVPRDYILGVIVLSKAKQVELQAKYPGLQVVINARYFSYRQDYGHWK